MKKFQSFVIWAGLSLALFALAVTAARAQVLDSPRFTGTVTLPFDVQWETLTLPAGEYTLKYGSISSGTALVVVTGKAEGSPRGLIVIRRHNQTSVTKNALVCIREGNSGYVRELHMGDIGETAGFRLPHGVEVQSKMIAKHQNKGGRAQLAQVPIRVERASVKPGAK